MPPLEIKSIKHNSLNFQLNNFDLYRGQFFTFMSMVSQDKPEIVPPEETSRLSYYYPTTPGQHLPQRLYLLLLKCYEHSGPLTKKRNPFPLSTPIPSVSS